MARPFILQIVAPSASAKVKVLLFRNVVPLVVLLHSLSPSLSFSLLFLLSPSVINGEQSLRNGNDNRRRGRFFFPLLSSRALLLLSPSFFSSLHCDKNRFSLSHDLSLSFSSFSLSPSLSLFSSFSPPISTVSLATSPLPLALRHARVRNRRRGRFFFPLLSSRALLLLSPSFFSSLHRKMKSLLPLSRSFSLLLFFISLCPSLWIHDGNPSRGNNLVLATEISVTKLFLFLSCSFLSLKYSSSHAHLHSLTRLVIIAHPLTVLLRKWANTGKRERVRNGECANVFLSIRKTFKKNFRHP